MTEKKLTKKVTPLQKLQQGLLDNLANRAPISIQEAQEQMTQEIATSKPNVIPVNAVTPNPYQPRKEFEESKLKELAESIQSLGQIEPIVVRRKGEGAYELIAGERRLRAFQILGLATIEAVIRETDDALMAVMALAENIDREDLSDYEIGIAIKNIEPMFTSKQSLAEYIGRSRTDVYRYTAFLDLPGWIVSRLNISPRLINRTNAQGLKTLMGSPKYNEELYRDAIINALDLIEAGGLTQNLLISRIEKLVQEKLNPRRLDESALKQRFELDGKRVGRLVHDDKSLTIKIDSSALTESDVKAIAEFISNKLNA